MSPLEGAASASIRSGLHAAPIGVGADRGQTQSSTPPSETRQRRRGVSGPIVDRLFECRNEFAHPKQYEFDTQSSLDLERGEGRVNVERGRDRLGKIAPSRR